MHPYRQPWLYCRTLWISLILTTMASSLSAKDWNIVTVRDQEYVTASDVVKFYQIDRLEKKANSRIFRHPSLIMEWKIGTQSIYVNKIKFNLSLPIAEYRGKALISTIDLAKLIDPILRPSYIRKAIDFDTVVIDPGHGGNDSGAKGRLGNEEYYNLDLSLRLMAELKKRDFRIVMTRTDDRFVSLEKRVIIANAQKKAIFISIHHNSSDARSASGVETFALPPKGTVATHQGSNSASASNLSGNNQDAENIALATAVHSNVIHTLRPIDRGIKRGTYHVLSGINIPAILYEGGFLTNPTEAAKIHDPNFRQRTAVSIAKAIAKFKSVVGNK